MKIISNAGGIATVKFEHSCGHISPNLTYGGIEFAEGERARQEARPCERCRSGVPFSQFEPRPEQLVRPQP